MERAHWVVIVALIAMVVVAAVFLESYNSGQIAYTLNVRLFIYLANHYGNASSQIGILKDVGVPGGTFATTRYLSYGVDGYYPVWARHYATAVWVDSRVVRNYTLGDFFEVWGAPLGPLNTLGYRDNASSFYGTVNSTTYLYQWSMCLQDQSHGRNLYSTDQWGSHVLRDKENITLYYGTEACALPGGQQ